MSYGGLVVVVTVVVVVLLSLAAACRQRGGHLPVVYNEWAYLLGSLTGLAWHGWGVCERGERPMDGKNLHGLSVEQWR